MNDDLKSLLIPDTEFYSAGGMDDVVDALCRYAQSRYRYVGIRVKLFATLAALGLTWCGLYHLLFISKQLPFAFLWLSLAAILFAITWIDLRGRYVLKKFGPDTHRRYLDFARSPTFKRLYDETQNFNQLLRAIEHADELAALNVDAAALSTRDEALRSLAQTRADLLRAVKLDKIRREFADVPEAALQTLAVDVVTAEVTKESAQLEHDASAYGQTLNEAIKLSLNIQDEIRTLQNQDRSA